MKQAKIAGIGELLWDVLPDSEQLGGAPINFAYHVSALGAEAVPISTIGNDSRGKNALKELQFRGVNTSYISVSEQFPTGYVTAKVDEKGIATYDFPDDIAWDHLADFIDVFCELGYFNVKQTEKILKTGKKFGLIPKIHVNQFNSIGGVQIGVKNNNMEKRYTHLMHRLRVRAKINSHFGAQI